jgi:ATP-dependent protease ClpP protease subunit
MSMKNLLIGATVAAASLAGSGLRVRGDIVLRTDGRIADGKLTSESPKELVFQPDGSDASSAEHIDRSAVSTARRTDEHGGWLAEGSAQTPSATQPTAHWSVPAEPPAPAVHTLPASAKSYYVIPLHGEVGSTVLASALEKSLADAVLRKPTVVVLDINSPGGLVSEAEKIVKVIHHYNKQLRIVALTDQDLSAAAIVTLSVREIYVKSSSTIGAATSFIPSEPKLSAKVEEKMQSAWRAVARNSAEEGEHEPLLAEAMIDNDVALHLEKVDGKPLVKEGDGDKMLCRKGKILTLTSHEAVACGLAAGEADDLAELGGALHMAKWTECKGLGTLLADYLPQRADAFKAEAQKIAAEFGQNMQRAMESDPAEQVQRVVTNRPGFPQPPIGVHRFNPMIPQPPRPGFSPGGTTVITGISRTHWKARSLNCVLALQQAELNLAQLMSLCDAYGMEGAKDPLSTTLTQISAIRSRVFDDRNKYGPGASSTVAIAPPPTTPPASSGTPAGNPLVRPGNIPPAMPPTHSSRIRTARGTSILPPGATKTEQLGAMGGAPFVNVNPAGSPLLGFHYTMGNWGGKPVLRRFDPLFAKPAADVSGDPTFVLAREGYVVGGLLVEADNTNIITLQVIFVALKNGRIDASDSYKSDRIGTPCGLAMNQLAGKGETVIGVFGRYGMNMAAVGLVLAPAK